MTPEDYEWAQKAHSAYPSIDWMGYPIFSPLPIAGNILWYSTYKPRVSTWGDRLTEEEAEGIILARNFLREFRPVKRATDSSPSTVDISFLMKRMGKTCTSYGPIILAAKGLKYPVKRLSNTYACRIGIRCSEFDKLKNTVDFLNSSLATFSQ
jgi:hypothetical protein